MRKVVEIPVQLAITGFGVLTQYIMPAVDHASRDSGLFPWLEWYPWSLHWGLFGPPLALCVLTHALMLIHNAVNASFNSVRIRRARALVELSEIRKSAWQRMPLLYLLELSQDHPRNSTHSRDHLFALLGISQEAHDPALYPHDKEPIEKIVVRYCNRMRHGGLLFPLLHRASVVPLTERFPSWAPNWTAEFTDPLCGYKEDDFNLGEQFYSYLIGVTRAVPTKIGAPWFSTINHDDRRIDYIMTPSTWGNEPDYSTALTIRGSLYGRVSRIADDTEYDKRWQDFRIQYENRMSSPPIPLNPVLTLKQVRLCLILCANPTTIAYGLQTLYLEIARVVTNCYIANPFHVYISPLPTDSFEESPTWRSRIIRCCYTVADLVFWMIDYIIFALTWTDPVRWQLASIFDRFPGHQPAFWAFWSLFRQKKMRLGSLRNVRLGLVEDLQGKRRPCFIFSDSVAVGDRVCLFKGCRIPFVLREIDEKSRSFRLVGECYTESFITGKYIPTTWPQEFILH
jgi:hypothetical protein